MSIGGAEIISATELVGPSSFITSCAEARMPAGWHSVDIRATSPPSSPRPRLRMSVHEPVDVEERWPGRFVVRYEHGGRLCPMAQGGQRRNGCSPALPKSSYRSSACAADAQEPPSSTPQPTTPAGAPGSNTSAPKVENALTDSRQDDSGSSLRVTQPGPTVHVSTQGSAAAPGLHVGQSAQQQQIELVGAPQEPAQGVEGSAGPDSPSMQSPSSPRVQHARRQSGEETAQAAATSQTLQTQLPCRLPRAARRCLGAAPGQAFTQRSFALECTEPAKTRGGARLLACVYAADSDRPTDEECGLRGLRCNVSHAHLSARVTCTMTPENGAHRRPFSLRVARTWQAGRRQEAA